MSELKPYRILLFYKYVPIANYESYAKEHLEFCKELGLRGRILVAPEGINGTVSGTVEQTDRYMESLKSDPRFQDMEFKIDESEKHAFKKMFVRPKREIVTMRLDQDIHPWEMTGKHLSPREFFEKIQSEDVLVIDGRNEYEYDIGHFRNAIRPKVRAFREFPEWIRNNLGEFKEKPVLMYCTGGIRCEKLSGFFLQEGFQDVSQLHGGIVTYGKDPEVKGALFDGKCYVFDERISVNVNQVEDVIVGHCYHCGTPEDTYVNCANPRCHLQHICCPECEKKHQRFCSEQCRDAAQSAG
ncbi:rhodanese-related sulfurtransferase [Alicyclobacillus tolerans]|uniref:oxygen-dependent tRNA uridine(34) hydroxylase TrhO n=1 Tax=Alicyclobacillus tolerans TaxID=90970 RepID=UPI001F35C6BE|nr:rhodanese-related sulfurtransferase [Alicyclobacillus tolerans]MCF8567202.1 rhodanese-related sulfurtransferase [Alicyclobacillus tolerans]